MEFAMRLDMDSGREEYPSVGNDALEQQGSRHQADSRESEREPHRSCQALW